MDQMNKNNSSMSNQSTKGSNNTFQGENKEHDSYKGEKSSGCGCGCKSAPADDEIVEIEEEDFEY